MSLYLNLNGQDLTGAWENQNGSVLFIEGIDSTTGVISGYFTSSSGTEGEKFSILGYVNKLPYEPGMHNVIAIAFTVRWENYGSITSWSGYYSDEKTPVIHAMWHLVRPRSAFHFEHILTGSETFHRQ